MKGIITVCSECASKTEFQKIAIEFERKGMKVVAHGIAAMVCPHCGEQYIPAAVSGAVLEAVNKAFDAMSANLKRSYVVSNGKGKKRKSTRALEGLTVLTT